MPSPGAAGWQVVSLGPRILRAETAALASVTVVLDWLAALGAKHPYRYHLAGLGSGRQVVEQFRVYEDGRGCWIAWRRW